MEICQKPGLVFAAMWDSKRFLSRCSLSWGMRWHLDGVKLGLHGGWSKMVNLNLWLSEVNFLQGELSGWSIDCCLKLDSTNFISNGTFTCRDRFSPLLCCLFSHVSIYFLLFHLFFSSVFFFFILSNTSPPFCPPLCNLPAFIIICDVASFHFRLRNRYGPQIIAVWFMTGP